MIPVVEFVHISYRIDGNRDRIVHRGVERPQSIAVKAKTSAGKSRDGAVATANLAKLEEAVADMSVRKNVHSGRRPRRTPLLAQRFSEPQ